MAALTNTELLTLTQVMRKMFAAADTSDWDELSRLDNERRCLLQSDAAKDDTAVQVSNIIETGTRLTDIATDDLERAAMIEEIEALDQRILASAQEARHKLLDKNREQSAQVNAKKLYAQTSLIG